MIVDFLTALYCLQPELRIPGYSSSPAFFHGSSEKPDSAQAGSYFKVLNDVAGRAQVSVIWGLYVCVNGRKRKAR